MSMNRLMVRVGRKARRVGMVRVPRMVRSKMIGMPKVVKLRKHSRNSSKK